MIRVLLAEDQGRMRSALAMLLALEHDIEVAGQADNGGAVLPLALQLAPDALDLGVILHVPLFR
jgi:two-component system response regulator DesR